MYEYVALIGVDGAGRFFRQANTPNLDRIMAEAATSEDVLTSIPTISGECWGAMLHGVKPEYHRLTNGICDTVEYDRQSPYPSLFREIRKKYPDAPMASISNWNPINFGIIENGLDVYKDTAGEDEDVTAKTCEYLSHTIPKMLFVQFDWVDGYGHFYGYGADSPKYLEQIHKTDGFIGEIYKKYEEAGVLDKTLFIVTADHGGTPGDGNGGGGSHGGDSDAEKYVYFGATGYSVKKHGHIEDMAIRDTAAIVLYALGVDIPETWDGRVPSGLFEGVTAYPRKPMKIAISQTRSHDANAVPGPSSIEEIVGKDLNVYLKFENDFADATGKHNPERTGKYYFLDGYYGKGMKFDDGYLTINGFSASDKGLTVGMWMKSFGIKGATVCSAVTGEEENKAGFKIVLEDRTLDFFAFGGKDNNWVPGVLPLDYVGGWVHVMFTIDYESNKMSFYVDFDKVFEIDAPQFTKTIASVKDASFIVGQNETKDCKAGLAALLDDFIVCDKALDDKEIAKLAGYYSVK